MKDWNLVSEKIGLNWDLLQDRCIMSLEYFIKSLECLDPEKWSHEQCEISTLKRVSSICYTLTTMQYCRSFSPVMSEAEKLTAGKKFSEQMDNATLHTNGIRLNNLLGSLSQFISVGDAKRMLGDLCIVSKSFTKTAPIIPTCSLEVDTEITALNSGDSQRIQSSKVLFTWAEEILLSDI